MPAALIPLVSALGAAVGGTLGAALIMGAVGIGTFLGYGLLIAGAYSMAQRAKRKARNQYNASQVDRNVNVGTTTMPRELVLGRVRKGGSVIFRASTGAKKDRFVMVLALAGHECDGIEEVYLNDTKVALDSSGFVTDPQYSKSTVSKRYVTIPAGSTSTTIDSLFVPGTTSAYFNVSVQAELWGGAGYEEAYPVAFTQAGTTVTLSAPQASPVVVSYDVQAAEDSKARVRWYLGAPGQTADAYLQSLFPGVWTAAHKLTGITYAICEFIYDETAFPSGIPTVTFVMRGAKCYDPRSNTTAWTRNPALHARHVITHPSFGQRKTVLASEDARIATAANACDLKQDWLAAPATAGGWGAFASHILGMLGVNGFLGSQNLFTSDIVVSYGASAADVLDDLTQAMGGYWAFASGELYLRAGVYSPPVVEFTQADLASELTSFDGGVTQQPVTITTHKARVDKINTIKATIWDAAQDYKSVPLQPVQVPSFVARDKAVLNADLTFPAVTSSLRAAHLCKIILRDARDSLTATLNLKLKAYPVEIFDVIELTIPRYGWDRKQFIVLGRTWTPQGLIQLSVKETSAQIFEADSEYAVAGFAPNTNLPNPWFLGVPAITSVTSGTEELSLSADGTISTNIRVRWSVPEDASLSTGTGFVEVRYGPLNQQGEAATLVPADFVWKVVREDAVTKSIRLLNVRDGLPYAIQIRARNTITASTWSNTVVHVAVGKAAAPSNVTAPAVRVANGRLAVQLSPVPDLDAAGYEVRLSDSGWGEENPTFRGNSTTIEIAPYQVGLNTWYVKAYDTSGNYSLVATAFSYSLPALPNVTSISSVFADTSLTAATVTLSWVDAAPELGLSSYELSYSGNLVTVRANTVTLPADWVGNRTFTIKTVDSAGFKSVGASTTVEKRAPAAALNFKAQVIDNTVLLYWNLPAKTSLPISHVLLKKGGTDWATAQSIGTKDGEFTTLTELSEGTYTYRLAVVDTDGVQSTPVSLTTKVSQPPDFIFNGEFNSAYSGTKNNSISDLASGYLYMPVNTSETFAQHFTSNSWTTPQAQIAAGYPWYPQPGTGSGYYEEVFDFGTILASSNVSLNLTGSTLAGSVNLTYVISLSADGTTYTDYPGLTAVFGTSFRYVKVRVTATQATVGALYELRNLNVRLDAKLKSDAGSTLVTTDVNGTLFSFNSEFVEVVAINPSANGSTLLTPVCDFYDVVQSGTYSVTSGVCTVTITAHKAVVGGRVRIAPASGNLPVGVYTVATVPTANTLTFTTASPNTSGNALLYHNFGKLHLFNSSGVRVAGTVSWAIRGF